MLQTETPARNKVLKHMNKLVRQHGSGERLPSVRKISSACRVSTLTVQAVVEELCSRGVIETRPRSGIYVAGGEVVRSDQQIDILFVTSNAKALEAQYTDRDTFHPQLLHDLAGLCGQDMRSTRVHVVPSVSSDSELHDLISRVDFHSCVVIGMQEPRVNQILIEHQVHFVHLFPAAPVLPDFCVAVDNQALVQTQLEHLRELGHRQIGLMDRADLKAFHRDQAERRTAFYRLTAEAGQRVSPHWVQNLGYEPATAAAAVRRMLADPADRPTAAIVPDSSLPVIYQVLHELGLTPGKDIAIVGTDGLPMSMSLHPAATSLWINSRAAASMALKMLSSRVNDADVEPQRLWAPLELIVRETSCPPASL